LRVLVIEDDRRVRTFIERGLAEAGLAVDAAADGEEGLRLAQVYDYDAIVLDLMLPRLDGLSIVRRLRKAGQTTRVLILTARGQVEDRVLGLDAGADDYLPKPFVFAELLARLRALLRRGSKHTSVLEIADLQVNIISRSARRGDQKLDLTAKEFALLEYLARHEGEVLTRSMIAEHVWDMDFDSGSNIIDVYIRYLRRKVDDPFDLKLIHTRRGIGYVLSTDP